ncbi:MAG TPA: NAD(P)-binding domain-containing protein [Mycobacterium sp.]|jgi:6-phosphogluconate dehydrogenase (decarboxylating)|nr:NAD(P)-binding domain-containing protein [Mycobacterium sp.]
MQLGLLGLGKLGFNMRERLREGGHEVIGYDPRPEVTDVPTLAGLAGALTAPRVVWVMVPSHRVPVPVIAASLFARFASRQDDSPTMKAVSALHNQFGGHAVKRVSESG